MDAPRGYLTFVQLAAYVGYEPKTTKMATKLAESFVQFHGVPVYRRLGRTRLVKPADIDKALAGEKVSA